MFYFLMVIIWIRKAITGKAEPRPTHKRQAEPEQETGEEEPEDDEMEIQDAGEYIPDPAQDADAQLDQVKKQLAASLAEDSEQTRENEKEAPKAEKESEDDDFEVFDLDDEL